MKIAAYIGGLLGLALLVTLVVRADFTAMLQTLAIGGWRLLWLIPYRAVYFVLYALGWLVLLRPYDVRRRAGLGYLFWVTSVRDAVDRLLPVASVGGGVAGIRLLRWRGLAAAPVSATVIVEIVLTLSVMYLFTAVGLLLLLDLRATGLEYRHVLLAFLCTLPIPAVTALVLRYGSVFQRLHGFLAPLVGASVLAHGAVSLDHELRACLRRGWALLATGSLQFAAFFSGSFEVWFALRLCGHPVGASVAIVLESMTQALRHLAFVVPAGLGVQEVGLVLFGQMLGISSELALAVSMAKRLREVLCGLPSLLSWQWAEGRRLRRTAQDPS
ncbi:MAG: lysylphosphatidylglycerol synthase domain-containing protein [Steroidobacterales bacterium]